MSKKLNDKESFYIFFRYLVLLLLAIGNLYLFYLIFSPITVYLSLFFLRLIYTNVSLLPGNIFLLQGRYIQLIGACIAGAAYYFLLILNLTTPLKPKVRVKSIIFLFLSFLIVNVARIIVFSVLDVNNYSKFNQVHLFTWYFGSTVFIVLLWFINVYLFKIKAIPVYSDFKRVLSSVNT